MEDDISTRYVDESILHQIIITEGTKAYLTKRVSEDNKDHLFKPYKDLCAVIGNMILECSPKYKYPKSLASTIIEMAHFQNFFMNNLPSLTDFGQNKDEAEIVKLSGGFGVFQYKKGIVVCAWRVSSAWLINTNS